MKLVRYLDEGSTRLGVVDGSIVHETAVADVFDILTMSPDQRAGLARSDGGRPIAEVELLAPLYPRKNVFAIGKNYIEHVREAPGANPVTEPPPERPIVFSKPPSSIIGPGQSIDTSNDPSSTTDYEGELAVVIGTAAKRVDPSLAMKYVFGYTIVNDVSARWYQRNHGQWLMGKGPDTFCPMGPCIVTADEISEVSELNIETTVNGEVRQQGSVADLVFDIPTLISTISSVMTLEPGDIIATGTPSGVGAGFDPPRYLRPGDMVDVTVDGIGTLSNPVN